MANIQKSAYKNSNIITSDQLDEEKINAFKKESLKLAISAKKDSDSTEQIIIAAKEFYRFLININEEVEEYKLRYGGLLQKW